MGVGLTSCFFLFCLFFAVVWLLDCMLRMVDFVATDKPFCSGMHAYV